MHFREAIWICEGYSTRKGLLRKNLLKAEGGVDASRSEHDPWRCEVLTRLSVACQPLECLGSAALLRTDSHIPSYRYPDIVFLLSSSLCCPSLRLLCVTLTPQSYRPLSTSCPVPRSHLITHKDLSEVNNNMLRIPVTHSDLMVHEPRGNLINLLIWYKVQLKDINKSRSVFPSLWTCTAPKTS